MIVPPVRVGGFVISAERRRNGQVVVDGKAPQYIGHFEMSEIVGIACNRVNALPDQDCEPGRFKLKTIRADTAGHVLREMKRVIREHLARISSITPNLGLFGKRRACNRSMPKRVRSRAPHAGRTSRRLRRRGLAPLPV